MGDVAVIVEHCYVGIEYRKNAVLELRIWLGSQIHLPSLIYRQIQESQCANCVRAVSSFEVTVEKGHFTQNPRSEPF